MTLSLRLVKHWSGGLILQACVPRSSFIVTDTAPHVEVGNHEWVNVPVVLLDELSADEQATIRQAYPDPPRLVAMST